jgi:N6-adenosine-specific RNA methylase IME4
MIDLRCQDVTAMLAGLPDGSAALIHADPPWDYHNGGSMAHGAADKHYGGLSEPDIAAHMASTYRVAAPDAYLLLWCTFPKLLEWARVDGILRSAGWEYITGGAWGKTNGQGVGYHQLGDTELWLRYKKGSPRPVGGPQSNLLLLPVTDGMALARRSPIHSEKPRRVLETFVHEIAADALVVDCYAGESASLARACRALGRRYVGAELDPARHARALVRLSQQEMAWEGVA